MTRWWMTVLVVAVTSGAAVYAKNDDAEAPKCERKVQNASAVDIKECTITGTVRNIEKKKKDGTVMMSWFVLVTEDGSEVHLPKGKADSMAGSRVKLVGTGYTVQKKGKDTIVLKTITSVEKLDDGPGAVPVNPVK